MNGILIYTADSDSEGSLRGLFKQGRKSKNLAVCHSCTLLPEASCEEFNVLLYRALIVGNLNSDINLVFLFVYMINLFIIKVLFHYFLVRQHLFVFWGEYEVLENKVLKIKFGNIILKMQQPMNF